MQMEHFFPQIQVKTKKIFPQIQVKTKKIFPQIQVKTKKKGLQTRIEHFFPKIFAQMYTYSNYWGGCRYGPFSNYWGEYCQIIGGDISSIPPLFRLPWFLHIVSGHNYC